MKNKWNIAFYFLVITFVIFVIAFATPVIGVFSAKLLFVDGLGCNMSNFSDSSCLVFGYDVGDRARVYGTPFIGLLATPFAFFVAFWELLIVWVCMIIGTMIMANRTDKGVKNETHRTC